MLDFLLVISSTERENAELRSFLREKMSQAWIYQFILMFPKLKRFFFLNVCKVFLCRQVCREGFIYLLL